MKLKLITKEFCNFPSFNVNYLRNIFKNKNKFLMIDEKYRANYKKKIIFSQYRTKI